VCGLCHDSYEDADAELPLPVDDEYWEPEDPAQAFRQPAGRPRARVTAFIHWLRLTEITSFVLMHFVRVFFFCGRRARDADRA
jgi:hypothetical protein